MKKAAFLILLMILAQSLLLGQPKIVSGVAMEQVNSIDLFNTFRTISGNKSFALITTNGTIRTYEESGKLQRELPSNVFEGEMVHQYEGGLGGGNIHLATEDTLSVATIKVVLGSVNLHLYEVNLKNQNPPTKIVSLGQEISAYGEIGVVEGIGNRFVTDRTSQKIVYLRLRSKKTGFLTEDLFKITQNQAGTIFIPLGAVRPAPSYNSYVVVGDELLYLSTVVNAGQKKELRTISLVGKGNRNIPIPDDCLNIDDNGAGDFILGCGEASKRSFFRIDTSGKGVSVSTSGIFPGVPRASSHIRVNGVLGAFLYMNVSPPQYFDVYKGDGIGIFDSLNSRVALIPLNGATGIIVMKNKVLVGTPNGTYALSPTLITDVSFTSGVISGKGVNVSLPGYKTEVLVNGIPVKGSTVTETTFRAIPEVPPSGAGEVSLRLTSLSDGVIANSINIARIFSPVTNVPKVTRITTMDRVTGKQVVLPQVEINREMLTELSPNVAVSFHGTNLAGGLPAPFDSASTFPLPTRLNSLEVRLGRTLLLRLYGANARQVNTVIPPDITPGPHTLEFVRYDTAEVPNVEARMELRVNVIRSNPVLRTVDLPQGWNTLEAYRPLKEGEVTPGVVTPDNPLSAGEVITAQGTGFGETLNPIPYGDVTPNTEILQKIKVFVNGQEARIIYIGTSKYPGVFQLSFEIPSWLSPDERGLYSIAFQYHNEDGSFREEIYPLNGNPQE